MKILVFFLSLTFPFAPVVSAAENRYDVLSKTLTPFIGVLAKNTKNPNRAVSMRGVIERMTGLPPELAGTAVELAAQHPDRLRVQGPILGERVTACRDGQRVWAAPGSKITALLAAAVAAKKLPKPDPSAQLDPLQLPFPEKQLVFLPALFQVRDAGSETVSGAECRVLDLTLMAELEKSMKEKGWSARVWVRPDYKPARVVVARPGWEISVRIEDVLIAAKLAEETWQAPAGDTIELDAPRFRQLMRAITR